jgi:hypothetical protein
MACQARVEERRGLFYADLKNEYICHSKKSPTYHEKTEALISRVNAKKINEWLQQAAERS